MFAEMGKIKIIELTAEQRAGLERGIEQAKVTVFGCAVR